MRAPVCVCCSDDVARKPAPRLFCDICDVFDRHETEDCPTQAMDDDAPAASRHHGDRHEQRAFCDICEGESQSIAVSFLYFSQLLALLDDCDG